MVKPLSERLEPYKTNIIYGTPAVSMDELKTFYEDQGKKVDAFYSRLLDPVVSFLPDEKITTLPAPDAAIQKNITDAQNELKVGDFDAKHITEMTKLAQSTDETLNGIHTYNNPEPKMRHIQTNTTEEQKRFSDFLNDQKNPSSAAKLIQDIEAKKITYTTAPSTLTTAQFDKMITNMKSELAKLEADEKKAIEERCKKNIEAQSKLEEEQEKTARFLFIRKHMLGKDAQGQTSYSAALDTSKLLDRPVYYYQGSPIYKKEDTFIFPPYFDDGACAGAAMEVAAAHGYKRISLIGCENKPDLASKLYREAVRSGLIVTNYLPTPSDLAWEIVYHRTESIRQLANPALAATFMAQAKTETNFFSPGQSIIPTFTKEQIEAINKIDFHKFKTEQEARTALNIAGASNGLSATWTDKISLPNLDKLREGQDRSNPLKNVDTYDVMKKLKNRKTQLDVSRTDLEKSRAALKTNQTPTVAKILAVTLKSLTSQLNNQVKDLNSLRKKIEKAEENQLANNPEINKKLLELEDKHLKGEIKQCKESIADASKELRDFIKTAESDPAADKTALAIAKTTLAESQAMASKYEKTLTTLDGIHNPPTPLPGPAP